MLRTQFSPRHLANLSLWLDGADASTVTLDNSNYVSQWNDKSGNGRDVSEGVSNNRPAYSGTINGLKVLTFDGSNDRLGTSGNYSETLYSAFAVAKWSSTSGARGVLTADSGGGATNTRGPQIITTSGTTNYAIGFTSAGGVVLEAPSTAANTTDVRVVSVVQAASTLEMWINDSSNGSSSCTQTSYTQRIYVGVATHGVGSGSMSGWFNGDIAEVILYSRDLSTAERQAVQRYLGRKWGVSI